MLKMRVMTALVLLLVFVPVLLFAPPAAFAALTGCAIALAAWEWGRLLKLVGVGLLLYVALAVCALLASTWLPVENVTGLYRAAAVFWLLAVPYLLWRKPILTHGMLRNFLLVAGIALLAAAWRALLAAREHSISFVLALLLIVWCADIGAYCTGKTLGKHKLAAAISPGKTWEGAIGGWLFVVVVALFVLKSGVGIPAPWFADRTGWPGQAWVLVGITFLVVISIVGDLFESLLKRQAGVKDSSNILPGHGGVLDRIDALLPVLPLALLWLG
jgi:phosphatidate cytidylyltransferase